MKTFTIIQALFLSTMILQASDRPNVVIIYGDDVGYGDVGAYGSKLIPTPNIDKLASEGLNFLTWKRIWANKTMLLNNTLRSGTIDAVKTPDHSICKEWHSRTII